ncbi:MAG TPA: hypothetical protein VGF76_09500 [Polyangiaceae bacterium]
MGVPAERRWLFWDVEPDAIDLERDRRYVLARVLERGRLADVRWAAQVYGLDGVHEFFRTGGHPELSRATVGLWRAFFNEQGDPWPNPTSWRKTSAAPWID